MRPSTGRATGRRRRSRKIERLEPLVDEAARSLDHTLEMCRAARSSWALDGGRIGSKGRRDLDVLYRWMDEVQDIHSEIFDRFGREHRVCQDLEQALDALDLIDYAFLPYKFNEPLTTGRLVELAKWEDVLADIVVRYRAYAGVPADGELEASAN